MRVYIRVVRRLLKQPLIWIVGLSLHNAHQSPHVSANGGLPHTPWAQGLRDQIQKRALQTQKILRLQALQCSEGN